MNTCNVSIPVAHTNIFLVHKIQTNKLNKECLMMANKHLFKVFNMRYGLEFINNDYKI